MRKLLFGLPLLFLFQTVYSQAPRQPIKSKDGIEVGSLIDAGFDLTLIKNMEGEIENSTYPNIHSVLIAKRNKLVYENYWPGKDESWGKDLGVITHAKDSLHDIRSVTKSFVSACIGIAIEQGKIKGVDQKVFDFFPEYSELDTGLKSTLTIKHLLTMTSGLKWNEEVPYDNPENSEIQMVNSVDKNRFVLSQPMDFAAGQKWKYNGGTTQLLAAILEKSTGKSIEQFAKEYLFLPLGINNYQWIKYPGTDISEAASGLRLTSRDMLKFGLLYHQKGIWKRKRIIPEKWIEDSFRPSTDLPFDGGKYGYQFWIWPVTYQNKPIQIVTAVGNGDQRIFIDKARDLVIVVTAGNYNKWFAEKNATALVIERINPALIKK